MKALTNVTQPGSCLPLQRARRPAREAPGNLCISLATSASHSCASASYLCTETWTPEEVSIFLFFCGVAWKPGLGACEVSTQPLSCTPVIMFSNPERRSETTQKAEDRGSPERAPSVRGKAVAVSERVGLAD